MSLKRAFINLQQVFLKTVPQTGINLGTMTCDLWLCESSFIWKTGKHG